MRNHSCFRIGAGYLIAAMGLSFILVPFHRGWGEKTPARELLFLDDLHHLFRRVLANYFWIKADDYMHHGDPLFQKDATNNRIVVGYSYNNNKEIVPLLTCAVFLDPTFIEAFELLGTHLASNLGDYQKGLKFLEMGVSANRENPESYQLVLALGQIHFLQGNFQSALPHLKSAEALLQRLEVTPQNHKKVNLDRQLLLGYLAHCHFELREFTRAHHYATLFGDVSPNNRMGYYFKTGKFIPFSERDNWMKALDGAISPIEEWIQPKSIHEEHGDEEGAIPHPILEESTAGYREFLKIQQEGFWRKRVLPLCASLGFVLLALIFLRKFQGRWLRGGERLAY